MRFTRVQRMAVPWLCALLAGVAAAEPRSEPRAQLYVTARPADASVFIDGRAAGAPPVTVGVEPGRHLLVIAREGCGEHRETVTVEAGQRIVRDVQLLPLTGLVLMETKPAGAGVEVSGAFRGKTPLLLTDLPLGRHRLRASLAGYATREVDLDVKDRKPLKVVLDLQSELATLDLRSRPEGALVTVNGLDAGTTPTVADRVAAGEVTVEFSLEGHRPLRNVLKLATGESRTIEAVLEPMPASLTVVTIPPKARVYVNNQFRGEAPVTLPELAPAAYRVRAELAGFLPMARDVELDLGAQRVEEFRLQGNVGAIEVTSQPPGAAVRIDGTLRGVTTPKEGDTEGVSEVLRIDSVAEGRREVVLVLKGYYTDKASVSVARDQTLSLARKLGRRFVPNIEVVLNSGTIYRGELLQIMPNGDVKMDIAPGISRTLPAADIQRSAELPAEPETEEP